MMSDWVHAFFAAALAGLISSWVGIALLAYRRKAVRHSGRLFGVFLLLFLFQALYYGADVLWIYLYGASLHLRSVFSVAVALLPLVFCLYFNYPKNENGRIELRLLGRLTLGLAAFCLPLAALAGYYLRIPFLYSLLAHILTYYLVAYVDVLVGVLFIKVRCTRVWEFNFQPKAARVFLPLWLFAHLALAAPLFGGTALLALLTLAASLVYLCYVYPLVFNAEGLQVLEYLVVAPPQAEIEEEVLEEEGGPGEIEGENLPAVNYEAILRKLEQVMEEDQIFLNEDLTQTRVCRLIGTNKTYLSRAINLHYNMSFSNLLNTYRVNMAKSLILDLERPQMQDIARRVGFKTISCFNDAFKRINGLTPTQWREKEAGIKIRRRRSPQHIPR